MRIYKLLGLTLCFTTFTLGRSALAKTVICRDIDGTAVFCEDNSNPGGGPYSSPASTDIGLADGTTVLAPGVTAMTTRGTLGDAFWSGDPVNAAGEMVVHETDLSFPGYGIDFSFERTYRNRASDSGPIGGWDFNYNQHIVRGGCTDPGALYFSNGAGGMFRFEPNGQGGFSAIADLPLELWWRPAETLPWVMRDSTGVIRRFTGDGNLATITDLADRTVRLNWVERTFRPSGQRVCGPPPRDPNDFCPFDPVTYYILDSIVDTTLRTIYLRWTSPANKTGMLSCLTLDPSPAAGCNGALVTYTYDNNDKMLEKASDALGNGNTYGYQIGGPGPNAYLGDEAIDDFCHGMCDYNQCWGSCLDVGTYIDELVESGYCKKRNFCNPFGASSVFYCNAPSSCMTECAQQFKNPAGKQYSPGGSHIGNLTSITNADGVRVVRTVYGDDPLSPSFDRVIEQYMGPTDRSDRKITWQYHDLERERDTGAWGTQDGVDSLRAYKPRAICDCLTWDATSTRCTSYGPARDENQDPPLIPPPLTVPPAQRPVHAVVVHDLHGVVRTRYLSSRWDVVREVNRHASDTHVPEITNIDYDVQGRVIGVENPAGIRTCRHHDSMDRTLETTELPRPGFTDTPRATWFGLDADGLVIDETQDAAGTPSHVHYGRWQGQVLTKQEEISSGVFATTTYTYPWNQLNGSTWIYSAVPDSVISPWGSQTSQFCSGIYGAGPCTPGAQTTIVNPEGVSTKRYAQYDWRGRKTFEGTWDAFETSSLDDAGRPTHSTRQVTGEGHEFVWYGYTNLQQPWLAETERWRKTTTYDTHGGVATMLEEAKDGSAAPRMRCYDRDLVDGHLLAEIAPEGDMIKYTYDDAGRLVRVERGFPSSTEMSEDWALPCAQNVDENTSPDRSPGSYDEVASYTYGANGLLYFRYEGGVLVSLDHDGFGRVREEIRSDDSRVRRNHDSRGRVRWEAVYASNPGAFAKPQSGPYLDYALSAMTEWAYDLRGRKTREDRWHFAEGQILNGSLHAITSTAYLDDFDHVNLNREARNTVTVTQGADVTTRITDGAGRVVEERLADNHTIVKHTWLDDRTDVETAPNANGVTMTTRRVRDPRGLVTDVYDAEGQLLEHADHDIAGHTTHASALSGAESWSSFDAFGRLTLGRRKVDDRGEVIDETTEWDRNNQVIGRLDGLMMQTRFLRDAVGRIVQEIDPSGRAKRSYYESNGTPRPYYRVDDVTGTEEMFGYDGANLVQEYVWDGANLPTAGQLLYKHYYPTATGLVGRVDQYLSASDGTEGWSTVTARFDSHGNRTDESSTLTPGMDIRHTHDGFDRRLTTTLGNDTIQYINEPLGRPVWVNLNGQRVVYITYSAAGEPSQLYFGSPGWSSSPTPAEVRTYDLRGRLTDQAITRTTISQNDNQPIAQRHYALGHDGAPRQRWTSFAGQTPVSDFFQVDYLGRVIGENRVASTSPIAGTAGNADVGGYFECLEHEAPAFLSCGASLHQQKARRVYWYDAANNWERRDRGTTSTSVQVGPVNELRSFGDFPVASDSGGNTTLLGATSYVHDARGRLIRAEVGGAALQYSYDPLGRRAIASDGNQSTYTVWDGDEILAIGSAAGANAPPASAFTLRIGAGLDRHLALYERSTGRRRYLHQGPDGSVLAATDESGLLEGYTYTAFGDTTIVDGAGHVLSSTAQGNRLLFQGQLHDPQLGGYWMRSREYLPSAGRFLSQDPTGIEGGLNLYSFVGGRPLTNTDPFGHEAKPTQRKQATSDLPAYAQRLRLVGDLAYPFVYTEGDKALSWFNSKDPGFTGIFLAGGLLDVPGEVASYWTRRGVARAGQETDPLVRAKMQAQLATIFGAGSFSQRLYASDVLTMIWMREMLGPKTLAFGPTVSYAVPGFGGALSAGSYFDLRTYEFGAFLTPGAGFAAAIGAGAGFTAARYDSFANFEGACISTDVQVGSFGAGDTYDTSYRLVANQIYVGTPTQFGATYLRTYTLTFPWGTDLRAKLFGE